MIIKLKHDYVYHNNLIEDQELRYKLKVNLFLLLIGLINIITALLI